MRPVLPQKILCFCIVPNLMFRETTLHRFFFSGRCLWFCSTALLGTSDANAHHASGLVITLLSLPRWSGRQLFKQMIRNNASHLQLPCRQISACAKQQWLGFTAKVINLLPQLQKRNCDCFWPPRVQMCKWLVYTGKSARSYCVQVALAMPVLLSSPDISHKLHAQPTPD